MRLDQTFPRSPEIGLNDSIRLGHLETEKRGSDAAAFGVVTDHSREAVLAHLLFNSALTRRGNALTDRWRDRLLTGFGSRPRRYLRLTVVRSVPSARPTIVRTVGASAAERVGAP